MCVCVCVHLHLHAPSCAVPCTWRSEHDVWRLLLPFYHICSRDWTWSSGLRPVPLPTELPCWPVEYNLTFECFASLPRRTRMPEHASKTVIIWSWTSGFGAMEWISGKIPCSMEGLKKEEKNDYKGKNFPGQANISSQSLLEPGFIELMPSSNLCSHHTSFRSLTLCCNVRQGTSKALVNKLPTSHPYELF